MGLKEVEHLRINYPEYVSCATMSVASLSPLPLKHEDVESCFFNDGTVLAPAGVLYKKLVEGKYAPQIYVLNPNHKPSELLEEIIVQTTSNIERVFLGGIIKTKDVIQHPKLVFTHVVGILSIHANRKVKIIDTYSAARNRDNVRLQPYDSIDRRIFMNNQDQEINAVFFVGIKLDTDIINYFKRENVEEYTNILKAKSNSWKVIKKITDRQKTLMEDILYWKNFERQQSRLNRRLKNTNEK